jgi:hypothetical protein
MKAHIIHNAAALVLGVSALGWSSRAGAQTVVVQPDQQPAPQPPPPPSSVVVMPGVTQAEPPPPPWVVVNGGGMGVPPEPAPLHLVTRPNRRLLMIGLVAFSQAYIASVGIAATGSHPGDSNLWIPTIGPWLDLGSRPSCPSSTGCGQETGNRVLLVADGLLQTFGALEIIGAFMWPETVAVTTIRTEGGASFSFMPSKVGRSGYGLSAVSRF